MRKAILLILCCLGITSIPGFAQTNMAWPQTITLDKGKITIYQPQPESLNGNKLSARMAISVTIGTQDPVFGAVWAEALLNTNRNSRMATLQSLKIINIRFPDVDSSKVIQLKNILERELPKQNINISLDNIAAALENKQDIKSNTLNNNPPEIIYEETPSLLVFIDGEPKMQADKELGLQRVVNSPFIIVQGKDSKYYLYLSEKWYASTNITSGSWSYVKTPPKDINTAEKKIQSSEKQNQTSTTPASDVTPKIIVRTHPAEIIQSNGKADFKTIEGTSLLYLSNSEDNIFMNIDNQEYYVLLSGRWYNSKSLSGPWAYLEGDKLPADFKKIPEGSEKDAVLASIPGTPAAKEAIIDAQVPQTAKVDRKTATTKVSYDGEPQFKAITGTSLQYAVNSSATVLKDGNNYYTVDNGVWFIAQSPQGTWAVATERPNEVVKIPADNPTYNVKYVYIYDVTPDYVWMGYTPGYMGCYVYGGTVVYGTGFYYTPWFGAYYYPRPVTWGFAMHYNPWYGWSMGIGINIGCFSFGFAFHAGGWWGPRVYYPPYHYPYSHFYGPRPPVIIAPHNNIIIHNNVYVNNRVYNNNVYTRRTGITVDNRTTSARTINRSNLSGVEQRRPIENVQVGNDGNLYRRDNTGQLQERRNNSWQPTQQNDRMQQQQQNFQRSENRQNNFQSVQRSGNNFQRPQMQRGGGGGRRR